MFDDDELIAAPGDFPIQNERTKARIICKSKAPLEETEFKVMLEITENVSGDERVGVDLVTVLDCSTSMKGEKLEKLKIAMQLVIKKLSPIDRLSVVTFSSYSNRLCPLRQMTENSQAEIEMLVSNLVARGGTNISAGLEMGLQVLNNRKLISGRVVAIMLLSDGAQGHHYKDAAQVSMGNVPVYTFGLGADYDPKVLNAIANHKSGGTFTDVQNEDNLSIAFSQCLDGLFTVVLPDLKVTFEGKNSTQITGVFARNYAGYLCNLWNSSKTVWLGDLRKKELRKVIVYLNLHPVRSPQDDSNVLKINYTYSTCNGPFVGEPLFSSVKRVRTSNEPELEELETEEFNKTLQWIKEAREMVEMQKLDVAEAMIVEAQDFLENVSNQSIEIEIERLIYELQELSKLTETQYTNEERPIPVARVTSTDLQRYFAKGPSSRTKVRIINKTEAPLEETKFKVTLKLTGNESCNKKPKLDLMIVLDFSSRMQNEKMEKLIKTAMKSMIGELSSGDEFSIIKCVEDDTDPQVLLSRSISEYDLGNIIHEVDLYLSWKCHSGNISNGLKMGLKRLNNSIDTSGCMVAIMLLSDTNRNSMFSDATSVVPIYTFFLGTNPKPLKSLIERISSGGTFTHVQDVAKLSAELSLCLARLAAVVVQDLKVTFTQVDSTIKNVYGRNYPQYRDDEASSVTVSFGHLNKEELHDVNVGLLLPGVSSIQCADILEISYTYSFGRQLIQTNPRMVTITRRNRSPMINEARVVTDKKVEVANKMIIEAQKLLEKGVDETLNSEVQQLKRLMNSQKPYNEQESEEVTIDEIHITTPECGEGTIRSLENYSTASHLGQASSVHSNNDLQKFPIESLLDRTVVRQRIPESLIGSNNYANWSEKVKKDLKELNLWKVIEESPTETTGSIENVDTRTAIQKLRQFRENWMALILIIQACGFPTNLQIIDLDSARAAWDTLATNREQGSNVERFLSAAECYDWRKVESLLNSNSELATARIPSSRNTVLHLASLAGKVNIVNKLVGLMDEIDLEIQDKDGYTALANASINGDQRIAQCMVEKNERLVSIPTIAKLLPVVIAVMYNNKEMAWYLYCKKREEDLTNRGNINGATLLTYSIRMQFQDISFDLIVKYPHLAVALDHYGQSAFYQLACAPSAFRSGSQLNFWQRLMYICARVQDCNLDVNERRLSVLYECNWSNAGCRGIKRIYEMKSVHGQSRGLLTPMCKHITTRDLNDNEVNGIIDALHEAAAKGVVELIDDVLKKLPELRRFRDKQGSTLFMKAVEFRQEGVFSLLQGFAYKDKMIDWVDDREENILHKLKYNPVDKITNIQGAVLKIQKELQWLEEIKPIMSRDSVEKKNSEGKTPGQLFRESHRELMKNAEKWMYNTGNSCIIVGILVVTIMFAAAFTVPGGNDQNTGSPLYLRKKLFKVFIISDAISLFSSTTSVLIFLGILSSRYEERDFVKSLPRKMIFGLFTLFLSIATMMIAFAATLFMMLRAESQIILPTILSSLAVFPLLLYVGFLFPLLVEFTMSTYGPSIFNRKSKWWFFSFYLNKEVKWLLIG